MPRKAKESEPKQPSRVTVNAVNGALTARGYAAMLVKAGGYFFFRGPEANDWFDRTVQVTRINDLSIPQWVQAFSDLKKKNADIQRVAKSRRAV